MDDKDNAANSWQGWWPGYGHAPGPAGACPPPGAPPYWQGHPHAYHPYYGPYAPPPGWVPPAAAAGGGGLFSGLGPQNDAFLKGLLIGAGASLLLSNETVQKNGIAALVKLWAGVQGGVEELKERFRDIEAELQAEADGES